MITVQNQSIIYRIPCFITYLGITSRYGVTFDCHVEIGKRKNHIYFRALIEKTLVLCFPKSEQYFDNAEYMLDLSAD